MPAFPSFYDPERIGTLFYPDYAQIAQAAAAAGLSPAGEDATTVHLLLIDMQVDFCHAEGSLFVPGAAADIQRTIEFIYTYAEHITRISCSLDSHLPRQIFHPAWWADAAGSPPPPFTLIQYEDVLAGRWRPQYEPEKSIKYLQQLEEKARKTLTIWPYHVMVGSVGNALDQELFSAVMWHSLGRQTQPNWLIKGMVPQTEHYSIIQPEVSIPDHPEGGKNSAFLAELATADMLFIAGEAESHCVLETVADIVEAFAAQPQALDKLYLLQDCTSPVLHPEVDFQAMARSQFAEFEKEGIHLINSTDPLSFGN